MRGPPGMTKTTLAAALLLAARAYGDPAPTIELAVSGSIDAGIIATSIATELARPVAPLAANESCHAPCLAVSIAGNAATVTFTTTAGGTRQRTIELGHDRAQWTEMLTLLAGNLVRDEASELLADPPPVEAPAAPDVPAPPPVPVIAPVVLAPPSVAKPALPEHVSPIGFGIVPGASTDLFDLDRSHWISIGLAVGVSGNVHGLALSGAGDVARGVSGLQVSGAVAVAGDLTGVQLAGAATVAEISSGAQIAGAVAYAQRSHVQIAGAVTAAHGADLQIAGAVSAAELVHTQVAGGVAVARDSDFQIAGAVSASQRAVTQVAGGVNVTGHLAGFQLAPINVARRNDGVQLGVINVGGGPDGDAFGLINIVPGGRTELEATMDSDKIGTVMLRHGGRHWHNVYGFGGQSISEPTGTPSDDVWMFGLGVGPSLRVGGLPVDVEAIAWQVNHGHRYDEHLSLLNQLRLTVGVPLGPVTLVAGGAINAYVSNDHTSPFITARSTNPDPMSTDVTVKLWPSLFVGARI